MAVVKIKMEKWGGIEVSRLGFGCMRLPVNDDKTIDRKEAGAMIDEAVKGGVNYFDSAYVYHNGESEDFLGEAMQRYPRDSYYLATKLPSWQVGSAGDVDTIFAEQLRRLRTDFIDFYMMHALNASRWAAMKQHNVPDKLRRMRDEGKIKYIGFSYHGDFETFKEIVECGGWDFAQIQINYADYDIIKAKDYYNILCEAGIPVICMEPVRGGFLANPPEEVAVMMSSFEGGGVTPAGWAFRWCIGMDNMPVILSGMSTMEQVAENLDTFAADAKLTPAQDEMINKAAEILAGIKAIPCTTCGYCMDCPFGVDIPRVFEIYNQYQLFRNNFRGFVDYRDLSDNGKGVDKCTLCGACTPQCPQEISIPERLAEAKALLEKLM